MLLYSMFTPLTPGHDDAVLVEEDQVLSNSDVWASIVHRTDGLAGGAEFRAALRPHSAAALPFSVQHGPFPKPDSTTWMLGGVIGSIVALNLWLLYTTLFG